MPTIDELAPATAASDNDELLVSQAGLTRKITRAQVLAGLQTQMALTGGNLLGRNTSGVGIPEPIAVGENLTLANGTLSAQAGSFAVTNLQSGNVPSSTDLVPISQAGSDVVVSYGQFLSGLAGLSDVDASRLLVTPSGSTAGVTLANYTASTLPLAGGSMTGPLILSSDPASPQQAANKGYVDTKFDATLVKTGGTLSGALVLSGDPTAPLQAATKSYVEGLLSTVLTSSGGTLSGPLILSGAPGVPLQAATKSYVDGQIDGALAKTGGALSGALTLAGDPTSPDEAATKNYVDIEVATALPRTGGSLSGPLTLAADPGAALQAATRQYVDTRVARSGDTLAGPLVLAADPATPLQAATKQYVDDNVALALPLSGGTVTGALAVTADPTDAMQVAPKHYVDAQMATALPRTGGSLSGALTLPADPGSALEAATKQYVDQRVARSGDTLTGPLMLSTDPSAPLQAATKQYVDLQFASALPKSGGIVTGSLSVSADPTQSLEVASKHYVDLQVATALPLDGGTLSGPLTLAADPTSGFEPATKRYVDNQVSGALPVAGGTLTGPLILSGDPTTDLNAATKQYVDAKPDATGVINVTLPPYNAKLDGTTDDTAAFKAAYQAAASGSVIYVPNGVTKLQNPGNWGVPLTKWVKWVIDGTTMSDGSQLSVAIPSGTGPASLILPGLVVGNSGSRAEFSKGSSQPGDFSVLHTSYIVNHSDGPTRSVSTASRNDTIIYNSPNNYIWCGLDRIVWAGVQTPVASTPAQHVGRYVQTIRASATTDATGKPLPQPQLWAACLEYRDTTGKQSSSTNASITVEMDWFGNGPDDHRNRQMQSLVVGQNSTSGAPVEINNVIGVYLAAGHSGHAYKVFNVGIPFSTAVLDTTAAQQLSGAAAIRMAAGHAIAFEPTGSNKLFFDEASGTLKWVQGALTYVVGKGITVGFQSVYGSNTTLAASSAGNIVFLIGSGHYTITLPPASSVSAGVGYTFSALGSGIATVAAANGDSVDNGPVDLHQNDRYHVVSDGSGSWREIFRTNAVNPTFTAPPVLPSYSVTGLPTNMTAGAKAFAKNGRKPGEAAAAGSGVEVFYDGARWISVCSGTQVMS